MRGMPEQTDEALLDLAGRDETAFMLLFERHREVIFRVGVPSDQLNCRCGRHHPGMFSRPSQCRGASIRPKARCAHISTARSEIMPENITGCAMGEVDLEDTEIERSAGAVQVLSAAGAIAGDSASHFDSPAAASEALILFQYEELPLEEIAGILGIDIGAVKSRLHRARARLKRILTPYFQGSNTR